MNGDSYCDVELSSYIDWHMGGGNDVSLLLAKVSDTSRYGTVEMDASGRVTAFIEKRPESTSGYINAGVYLFRRAMLAQFPDGSSSMERDVFPVWLREQAIKGWVTEAEFIDIGIPSDYERSHEFMARVSR
jgi:NDP-sugar pyrophosphorylase family protein